MNVKVIPLGALGTNCYIVTDVATKLTAVIDPGDEATKVLNLLNQDGDILKYILLTHGHYDHTTAVPDLCEAMPSASVYIHQADANGAGSQMFPLAGHLDDLLTYDDGDELSLGDLKIKVIHTPGHSKGSVTLQAGNALFTGDTLFAGSCGRTDLPGGSYDELMASLKKLGEIEGNFYVCPGHDVTSNLDHERAHNPYLREAMA